MLGGPTGPACCPLSFLSSLPCFYLDLFSYPFSYFFPSFLLLSFPLLSLLDASNPFVTLFHPFPFESFVARIRVRVRVSVNVRVSFGISTLLFVRLSLPLSPNTYALPQPPIFSVLVHPVVGPFSEFGETFGNERLCVLRSGFASTRLREEDRKSGNDEMENALVSRGWLTVDIARRGAAWRREREALARPRVVADGARR